MPTLSDCSDLLGNSVGQNISFTDELNLVRARLIPSGNWKGSKVLTPLTVYSDADGFAIVTLPREFDTLLAGAVRSSNGSCGGMPMGVRNEWSEFSKNGLGYGGLTHDFQEVTGRFSVFQEWSSSMRIRFKFERSETSGTIYLSGTLDGEDVWALNTATWEKREAIAFSGTTTVTSTKYYDAFNFKVVKPVTLGRVSLYTVDDDGVETLCGVYEPSEKFPRWRRYRVAQCEDVEPVTATTPRTPSQFYTREEILALFEDGGTITVSAVGTHDLVFSAYITRQVKVIAQAGSGSYTHKFTLDNATVKNGGTLAVVLEIAQSANPTLNFYDNDINGSLLATIVGDAAQATYVTLIFYFDGDDWEYRGREI